MPSILLTPHFTLAELTFSETAMRLGLDNSPTESVVHNLKLLAELILEPARLALGPIHVNSGYRSVAVNQHVGGAPNSQHLLGCAADLVLVERPLADLYSWLYYNSPFDQLIYEFRSWVHVSFSPPPEPARGQALVSQRSSIGLVTYRRVLPADHLLASPAQA